MNAEGLTLVVLPDMEIVDPEKKMIMLQILNVVMYLGAIASAATSGLFPMSLADVTNHWQVRIAPAGWAFIIWAVIYALLGVFTLYQALSDECVPGRSNDAIFNKAGWWVSVNFAMLAIWAPIFQTNNLLAFFIALAVIVVMLFSGIKVLIVSLENRLSITEIIGMRVGFAIYSGWVSVATTLNISFVLKAAGLNGNVTAANIDESIAAIVTLCLVFCVYVFVTYMLKEPLYCCVLEWALFAIMDEQAAYPSIVTTCVVLTILNGCYIVGITIWLGLDKCNNYPKEMKGIFY